jgi:glycosyltransferase involved in cell wall biosynthesis
MRRILDVSGSVTMRREELSVTLIGTLPPIRGISPYTSHLLAALDSLPDTEVEFIGFRSLYPRCLYPGRDVVDPVAEAPDFPGVRIRNLLAWYNPTSWVWAGVTCRGRIVHAQWWSYILAPVYVVVLTLARLRGRVVVLTLHNVAPHETSRWRRLMNRLVLRLADHYIVHAEQNRESLVRVHKRAPGRVSVVPHGILEVPRRGLTRAQARANLGLAENCRAVLFFGHIRPYKGLDTLLRAFQLVRGKVQGAVLLVAGVAWKDAEPPGRLIRDLGLESQVVASLRFVPEGEVETYFVACDVVALPYTHFDAQSGVGTLALSFGKPLVVTDVGGLPELVGDPRAVVPAADPEALAGAISAVLEDTELRARLEEKSRERARLFEWDNVGARTREVYASLMQSGDYPC